MRPAAVIAVAWVAMDVWTYGTLCAGQCAFNISLGRYSTEHPEMIRQDEAFAVFAAATGPAGLVVSFVVTGMFQDGWRATSCVRSTDQ